MREIRLLYGLSGGKDSITLLMGLKALQRFYPKKFDLIAISVDPGFEFFNRSLLEDICKSIDVPLFIEESHIKEIVFDIRKLSRSNQSVAGIKFVVGNHPASPAALVRGIGESLQIVYFA